MSENPPGVKSGGRDQGDVAPVTIGIPYRDEGQSFELLAGGLIGALEELPSNIPREVIICVNGSRAGFADELAGRVASSKLRRHQARVITSEPGKLEAMKAVVRERVLQGYVTFVDSDVVLDPRVLRLLWETLEADPLCKVAYGQPVPVFPRPPNALHRLLRVHYALREVAYERPYFHGRSFMLRDWFLDDPDPDAPVNTAIGRRLRLHRGPLVDDIAMSRMAIARWGVGAIREVPSANVYFDPPDSLRGLYAGTLRVALELKRLDLLYPRHAAQCCGTPVATWRPCELRRFSRRVKRAHVMHRLIDTTIKCLARIHVWLVGNGVLKIDTLWIRVPGTKSFGRLRGSWHKFDEPSEIADVDVI